MSLMGSIASQLLGTSLSVPASPVAFFRDHIRPDNRAWSFTGHEYLRAMIADECDHIVVQKAAQMGVSTVAIGRLIHWSLLGHKVGYYLTDRDFMAHFVQDRFDPIINSDELLAQATMEGATFEDPAAAARRRRKGADNLRLKHIGQGSAWFMGLQKRKDVKSLDLDAFILDEVDETDQDLAAWLDDRVLHSAFQRRIELSQPSVPEWGIAERYDASDQKCYLHRCPRCRTWHCLEEEWPDCLVSHQGAARIVCIRCGARIRGGKTEWVAKHADRPISGYRLSQLFGPAISDQQIATRWQAAEKSRTLRENFSISILGLPFPGDRQPLSEEVLKRSCGDWGLGLGSYLARLPGHVRPLVLAGIDVGDLLHLVIGVLHEDRLSVVEAQILHDDWDGLADVLAPVDFFVIDAMPYKSDAKRLCRRPGLNGALVYTSAESQSVDYEEKHAQVPVRVIKDNRTGLVDEMASEMASGFLRLPAARLDATQLLKRHCKRLVKDFNPLSGKFEYKKHTENHYGMALTHLSLARRVAEDLHLGPCDPLGDPDSFSGGERIVPSDF
jgi:hypothetical protein